MRDSMQNPVGGRLMQKLSLTLPHARVVQRYDTGLPSLRCGFDSRPAHCGRIALELVEVEK